MVIVSPRSRELAGKRTYRGAGSVALRFVGASEPGWEMAENEPPNTKVVCANVILDGTDVLMVRESKPPALGRWSLPAGRLEQDESLRAAAAREALEETGLTVEVGGLLGIYHCPATLEGGSAISFVFQSTVTGGAIATSEEHPEVAFISRPDFEDFLAAGLVRGRHVELALAAADAGVTLAEDVVIEVGTPLSPQR